MYTMYAEDFVILDGPIVPVSVRTWSCVRDHLGASVHRTSPRPVSHAAKFPCMAGVADSLCWNSVKAAFSYYTGIYHLTGHLLSPR